MPQDFSRKITICVRKDLPEWQTLNAVAHIAAYFGNFLGAEFATGESFTSKDDFAIPRNTQYGIVVLEAQKEDLISLINEAVAKGIKWMGFPQQMIDFIDDDELQADLSNADSKDVDYLGVGLFGDKDVLREMTKHLKLWK